MSDQNDTNGGNRERPGHYDLPPGEWKLPWQPVVQAMYDGVQVGLDNKNSKWRFQFYAPMGQKTGLIREEYEQALFYMEKQGLVEVVDEQDVVLTELGLQIAQEMSARSRQTAINRTIMLAAIVTAIAAVLSRWPPEGSLYNPSDWANVGVFLILFAIGAAAVLILIIEFGKLELLPLKDSILRKLKNHPWSSRAITALSKLNSGK